eukprot:scaffold44806_cov15-Prasinocladus_malaysianus.AAC.1
MHNNLSQFEKYLICNTKFRCVASACKQNRNTKLQSRECVVERVNTAKNDEQQHVCIIKQVNRVLRLDMYSSESMTTRNDYCYTSQKVEKTTREGDTTTKTPKETKP